MKTTYSVVLTTPIRSTGVNVQENQLISIEFLKGIKLECYAFLYTKFLVQELKKYFSKIKHFNESCYKSDLTGTSFQKQVWEDLLKIPSRTIEFYNKIASKLKTSAASTVKMVISDECRITSNINICTVSSCGISKWDRRFL